MVEIRGSLIHMQTQDTSYVLYTGRWGLVETLYYGAKIRLLDERALLPKVEAGFGGDVLRRAGAPALSSMFLELSPVNKGDYRTGPLLAQMGENGATCDFEFKTARLLDGPAPSGGMPQGRQPDQVLALTLAGTGGLTVELFYSVFEQANVITKKMRVTNQGTTQVRLERALSYQLDLPYDNFTLVNLTGAWTRETQETQRPLQNGTLKFGGNTGASGNRCNPFFFLKEPTATEDAGEVYGFNLVYSGSHEGSVEVDAFGRTRVMHGITSEGFGWPLAPGESFITPEGVLTYSAAGLTGMSHNMHRFVRQHILPPRWRDADRPVLVNNWEGTYFNFNERKLLGMAHTAQKLGVELFVLDDGWYGERNNDKAGLGDYDVNRKKLPNGIDGLCRAINRLGMQFGLWFEPEMVSEDSGLFRAHPDWAIQAPGMRPATGRSQLVLDLCRPEVRDYVIREMGAVLDCANIQYVKWDMNRHIVDNYSPVLPDQGMFAHSYVLGLYQVFDAICATRPDILFEGCSSGGNRYDLGVLYYMPQMWISDDSDAHERQRIQTGASYGYPLCTMGCHVSAIPNHQTLRRTTLDTRFNTAMFGLLGYELDMTLLTRTQKEDVKAQVAFYKQHRKLLQYGDFYRLLNPFHGRDCRWMVTSPDKRQAMVGDYLGLMVPNSTTPPMRLRGLAPDKLYTVAVRQQKLDIDMFGGLINYILPLHLNPDGALVRTAGKVYRLPTELESYTAYGDTLCKAGLSRIQAFSGAGYHPDMRFMHDFASRVYYLKQQMTASPLPNADEHATITGNDKRVDEDSAPETRLL